jgi:hypothetical protein
MIKCRWNMTEIGGGIVTMSVETEENAASFFDACRNIVKSLTTTKMADKCSGIMEKSDE